VPASVRVERALALAPADAEARWARARLRVASARRIWESGQTEDGRVLATWAERRREALPLFDGAVLDLTAALRARPSDPFLHDALGWAHAGAAAIDEVPPAARQAAAVTALRRAIALQPDNPYLYRSLAALALGQREPLLPIALGAARSAIARDPSLLPDLAGRFTPLGLGDAQWAQVVPDTADDRLELGALLDEAGLGSAAEAQYRRAVALAAPGTEALARHALARSLAQRGDYAGALAELDIALRLDLPIRSFIWRVGMCSPPAGTRRRSTRSARRSGAPRRAPPRSCRCGALQQRKARGREHSRSARSVGASAACLRYRRALGELLIERRLWPRRRPSGRR
jgi:tetratricopeptide (TPR) repeat protein